MTEPQDTMTPEEAMQKMATVTSNTRALRVRTEGLTIAVWGLIMAASYLTIIVPLIGGGGPGGPGGQPPNFDPNTTFNGTRVGFRGDGPPATVFFASRLAPLVWYGIGVIFTLGIWKSASLSFQTGLTTPRLLIVFGGWLGIFVITIVVFSYVEGGNPRSWHLFGWAVVIGLLALLNPLRFTKPSRIAFTIIALVALATGIYAQVANLRRGDIGLLSGIALGAPALAAGLYLLFRG